MAPQPLESAGVADAAVAADDGRRAQPRKPRVCLRSPSPDLLLRKLVVSSLRQRLPFRPQLWTVALRVQIASNMPRRARRGCGRNLKLPR